MAIISVENQYYFYFDIGGNTEFADGGGKIVSFVIEEFAGGSLPMFEFVFTTANFDILKNINEGTTINCTYGKDSDHTDELSMMIQKFEYALQSSQFLLITCRGYVGGTTALTQCEIAGYENQTSLDVIKAVASIDYKVKSDAKTPSDSQNWIRYNIPANRFIQEVWEHSYINDDNFLIYGINRHNEFMINDYKNATSGKEVWKFSSQTDAQDSIAIQSNYRIQSNHGLLNNISVYQKERRVFDVETGLVEKVITPDKKPILASGKKLNIQDKDPKNYGKVRTTTEAFHDNYHKAFYNNTSKIALYGAVEVHITTDSEFKKFELYDLAKFENIQQDKDGLDTELLSGLFLITKISRYWAGNTYLTSITLSKEALNNIKGSLK